MNKITPSRLSSDPDQSHDSDRVVDKHNPILCTAIGRQRVGKTALLNTLAQVYRDAGAEFDVWNLDMMNESHSMSNFHPGAISPPSAALEDQQTWLQNCIREQVRSQRDAVLDVGGGWTALHKLVDQTRLVDVLGRRGINLTVAYLLGPETADLDYLAQFQRKGNFLPPQTLLVLNEGLVSGGRAPQVAFQPTLEHPVVKRAIDQGARVVFMPALGCLSAVTDRKMSYRDFADDKQVPGFLETSFFDQELVALWLEREMPAFFQEIPTHWMPRLPKGSL